MPSIPAVERSTCAAFSVATIGRCRPVASANEDTRPDGSTTARSCTAKIVPLPPSDTTASPGTSPRPSEAAMFSPVPAEISSPSGVCPAGSAGPSTSGTFSSWPNANLIRSCRHSPVIGDQ